MKAIVRNGTPVHGTNLCLSCANVEVRKGHRVSQEEVFCRRFGGYGPAPVPYPVAECSGYQDVALQHSELFYATAWVLIPDVGYVPPDEFRRRERGQCAAVPA